MPNKQEKRGRPRVQKAKALGSFISTRLSAGDYKMIHEAIDRSPLSKSEWIREALLEKAGKGKPPE